MNTFLEYVMTPGLPAASRPASLVRLACWRSACRLAPRACSRTVASAWSSGLPSRARASALRIAPSVTPLLSPLSILEALIRGTLSHPGAELESGVPRLPGSRSEAPVVTDRHVRPAARRPHAAELHQPGDPVPVARVGGEQFEHRGVVRRLAG